MHSEAEKTQNNKSQSLANEFSQEQGNDTSTFQFVDNRPEVVVQRKIQEMADNSPRAKQLKVFQDMANRATRDTDNTFELKSDLVGDMDDKGTTQKKSDRSTPLQNKSVTSEGGLKSPTVARKTHPPKTTTKQARTQPSDADSLSQHKGPVIQRILRYGKPYRFIGPDDDVPEQLRDRGFTAEELAFFINAPYIIGFIDVDEVKEAVEALSEFPLLNWVFSSPKFPEFAIKGLRIQFAVAEWIISELNELLATVDDEDIYTEAREYIDTLSGLEDMGALLEASNTALQFIDSRHLSIFRLNENRQVQVDDGGGDIHSRTYGYHLTKLHNIPGIRTSGLDPKMGASDRGSLAMSTADQQVGSKKTSLNMVAFGLHPGLFRPYINQFGDRRQMIEGTPDLLQPAMLRFFIREEVRKSALSLRRRGIVDYMDQAAINTTVAIQPNDIEVLTPDGWIPIGGYSLGDHAPAPLREGEESERTGTEWAGTSIILTYIELEKLGLDPYTIAISNFGGDDTESDTSLLVRLVDQNLGTIKGLTFVFRGATMQTSGHRRNWDYAFSVSTTAKGGLPKWIQKNIARYQKEFQKLAMGQMDRVNEDYSDKNKKKQNTIPQAKIGKLFKIGRANGDELNCLLETVDQLHRNEEGSDEESVRRMREVLAAINLAPEVGMIDIYGGAGMQLANDLGLRIQVLQQVGNEILVHPIIGIQGRLVYILHTPEHFQPLWVKR